jgi:hypothetical protein
MSAENSMVMPERKSLLKAALFTILAAVAANVLALLVLRPLLGLSSEFPPFNIFPIILFTTLGVGVGMVVYTLIARKAAHPQRTWTVVALTALVVSIIPNVGLALNPAGAPFPGATGMAFGVLIVFHVIAGLIAWLLPARL